MLFSRVDLDEAADQFLEESKVPISHRATFAYNPVVDVFGPITLTRRAKNVETD